MATALGRLLVGLQLSDSAFPSGFYTMSHGLEGFRQADLVRPGEVGGLLEDLLVASIGPGDATALVHAHGAAMQRDWDAVAEFDHVLFASKLNSELRVASTRSGRQLIDIAGESFAGSEGADDIAEWARRIKARQSPGCQPISTAVCYAATGVSAAEAVTADLFAFCVSFVGAALRLRLTDHRGAQVVLREIQPVIETVSADALGRPAADIGGFAPNADIASAAHERAEARLFTT
jgi:urease accessory protein